MTTRELITILQNLGDEYLDKEVLCAFRDGFRTLSNVWKLGEDWREHNGKVLID